MNDQELKALIAVYQRRLNDTQAQAIVFEAKTIVQQEIINSLEQKIQEQSPRTNSKKSNNDEF